MGKGKRKNISSVKNKETYTSADKRAYYTGYGMGLAGVSPSDPRIYKGFPKKEGSTQFSFTNGLLQGLHGRKRK